MYTCYDLAQYMALTINQVITEWFDLHEVTIYNVHPKSSDPTQVKGNTH